MSEWASSAVPFFVCSFPLTRRTGLPLSSLSSPSLKTGKSATINEIFPLAESRWTCSASKISSNIESITITHQIQENKSLGAAVLASGKLCQGLTKATFPPHHPLSLQSPRAGPRSPQPQQQDQQGLAWSSLVISGGSFLCQRAGPARGNFQAPVFLHPASSQKQQKSQWELLRRENLFCWCCGCFMAHNPWFFSATTFSFAPVWSAAVFSPWNLNEFDVFLQFQLLWWAIYPRVFAPAVFLFQVFAHIWWNDLIRAASAHCSQCLSFFYESLRCSSFSRL